MNRHYAFLYLRVLRLFLRTRRVERRRLDLRLPPTRFDVYTAEFPPKSFDVNLGIMDICESFKNIIHT
jgi:hypothetical protein